MTGPPPPAAASRPAAVITLAARGVNRDKSGLSGAAPTKRFCAACLETPIAEPIWLHDAPERRAWSTK